MDLIAANEKPVIGLFCVSILHVVVVAVVTVVVVVVVVVAVVVVVVDSSLSMRHLYTYYDFLKTTLRLFSNAFAKTKGSLSLSLFLSFPHPLIQVPRSHFHAGSVLFHTLPGMLCKHTHSHAHPCCLSLSSHSHAHTFLHRHRSFLSLNTSGRNLSAEVYQCDSPPSTYPHLGPLSLSPFSFLALSPSRRCLAATGSRERADERARERLELTNDLGKNGDRFLLLSSTKTSCLCFSDFLKKVNFTGEEKNFSSLLKPRQKIVLQCNSAAVQQREAAVSQ